MTGQPYDEDDAEFEAFLQGKGPLAHGLAQVPQPEPPAALDAAVLAQVTAGLAPDAAAATAAGAASATLGKTGAGAAQGMGAGYGTVAAPGALPDTALPAGGAANDEQGPPDFQPRRWRERWRIPVALAAGVTAISIALPIWQDEVAQQQRAVDAHMQDMQIPAVPAAEPAVPAGAAQEPASSESADGNAATPAPPVQAPPQGAALREAGKAAAERHAPEARKEARAGTAGQTVEDERAWVPAEPVQQRSAQAAPVLERAPATAMAGTAPAPAPPVSAGAARADADAAAPAYVLAPPAPAPAPALTQNASPQPKRDPSAERRAAAPTQPGIATTASAEPPGALISPPGLVARIERLLKEGKRDEAQAEWERLRTTFPDYPVPAALREALGR